MGTQSSLLLGLLVLIGSVVLLKPTLAGFDPSQFPEDFCFGTATSAYQVEGGARKNGRGPSVWDTFTYDFPERIEDRKNGDVAVDFYTRFKEDISRMVELGMNAFRFSISWSRLLPYGKRNFGVNDEGIAFYDRLINEAIIKDLEPFVTIFHWDTPQALEDRYGGFLSKSIVADFRDFAELCFEKFGDRVRYWITLNEPMAYSSFGYDTGLFAPGRCSSWQNRLCQAGNSATEPYIVTHNLLLSHAAAVQVYKQKFQAKQNGKIGVTFVSWWMEPYSKNLTDVDAAKRALDFNFGWFMDPLIYGYYPRTMRENVGERLPHFTEEETKQLKGSIDFLGVNYYSARFVKNIPQVDPERISYTNDARADLRFKNSDGQPIGESGGIYWLRVAPFGIRYLLNYTKDNYGDPEIFITENGFAHDGNTESYETLTNDTQRVDYYDAHLGNVSIAMKKYKVKVRGYCAWSFMDNFEWASGYTKRFGLTYIDYEKDLERIYKQSAKWFMGKLQGRRGSCGRKSSPLPQKSPI